MATLAERKTTSRLIRSFEELGREKLNLGGVWGF